MCRPHHLTDREQIIHFFVTTSGNKLNKNHYNINFYKKRESTHIYKILTEYFNDIPQLAAESITLKYYHIFNIRAPILKKEDFINFAKGYAGKTHKQKNVDRDIVNHISKHALYSKNKTIELIHSKLFDKRKKLITYINDANRIRDKVLIASIFFHADNDTLPFKHCLKILIDDAPIDKLVCSCGKPKIIYQFKIRNTCTDVKCRREFLSKQCKERDSYKSFLSESARRKKSVSLTGRVFSETHKQNIKLAKKLQYSEEYKAIDKQMRVYKGIYKKAATTLKQKILNGEYTPTNNRGRATRIHNIELRISYRSKWEEKFHAAHQHLKFEYTRIPYSYGNTQHIYITDFTDIDQRIIYEIKPKSLLLEDITQIKIAAALDWCTQYNYTYKIITEDDFNFYE